jgi:hypothetical protein
MRRSSRASPGCFRNSSRRGPSKREHTVTILTACCVLKGLAPAASERADKVIDPARLRSKDRDCGSVVKGLAPAAGGRARSGLRRPRASKVSEGLRARCRSLDRDCGFGFERACAGRGRARSRRETVSKRFSGGEARQQRRDGWPFATSRRRTTAIAHVSMHAPKDQRAPSSAALDARAVPREPRASDVELAEGERVVLAVGRARAVRCGGAQ